MNCRTAAAVSLLAGAGAFAEVQPAWMTTYTDAISYSPQGMDVDAAGNSYICATLKVGSDFAATDIALTKFDPAGDFVWQRVFAGPLGQDIATAAAVSADGSSVFAVGRSSVPGFGNADYVVIKYDAVTGDQIWTRFYDGLAGGIDDPRDAAATPDGGIAATGRVWNDSGRNDYGTVKLDAGGSVVWDVVYGENGPFFFNEDSGERVIVAADGDVIVSGFARPSGSGNDVVTFRYDGATGATQWTARYSTSADERLVDLVEAPDGDIVVFGSDPFGVDRQWFTVRYDGATGAQQWLAIDDPGYDEFPAAVAVGPDGDVYVTGGTDPDIDDSNSNGNLITIAYDGATGAKMWLDEFGGEAFGEGETGRDVYAAPDGAVYVVGSSSSVAVSGSILNSDAIVRKYDGQTGDLLCMSSFDTTTGPTVSDAFDEAIVDAAGDLIVRGRVSTDPSTGQQMLLVKFEIGEPACIADVTGDGVVDSGDFFAFIGDFLAGGADVSGDGVTDSSDFFLFIDLFLNGCD